MPPELLRAIGILKKAAALVNQDLGKLPQEKAELIIAAVDEVIAEPPSGSKPRKSTNEYRKHRSGVHQAGQT